MRLKSVLGTLIVTLLVASVVPSYSAPAPKAGAVCKKVGVTQTYKDKVFTCKKSGKKLVWSKGKEVKQAAPIPVSAPSPIPSPSVSASPEPTPSPTPTPIPSVTAELTPTPTPNPTPTPTPTSFENLYAARQGVSYAAWKQTSDTIKASKSKVGSLEIFTGSNTKPYFDDYPLAVSLVSRAFPNREEPARTIVIRFNYQDLAWAEQTLRQKISTEDYAQLDRNENGRIFSGRCDDSTRNCRGAMQQSTISGTDISMIIQGVPNRLDPYDPTGEPRLTTGMLEAHEYFHALQRIPIMGKADIWPHAWFREGSAEWVQNAAINFEDFAAYRNFIKADCSGACARLSEAEIIEFLQTANDNYLPYKFEPWLNYSLGSYVIEILVALKGQDSIIEMYSQMATRINFASAFKNTYGVDWDYAIPIIAKTIYANFWGL